jgi:hypothetical protein
VFNDQVQSNDSVVSKAVNNYITFLLLNATSLAKTHALQHLQADLMQLKVDIALVTETWYNSKHSDDCVALDDFTLFRKDRSKRKGGGVCLYVRKSIPASVIFPSTVVDNIEIIWVKCQFNGVCYIFACCYHPPKPQYLPTTFVQTISCGIDAVLNLYNNSIIFVVGDFNQLNTDFISSDYGLSQIVVSPTHGNNLIDKVFTSRPDIFSANVFKSIVKTKHLAVHVISDAICKQPKRKR